MCEEKHHNDGVLTLTYIEPRAMILFIILKMFSIGNRSAKNWFIFVLYLMTS